MKWFGSREKLPAWAKRNGDAIEVIPSFVYPYYMEKLGVEEVTQYWLEVARRCMTEDLKKIVGGPLHIRILKDLAWRLENFPVGDGDERGRTEFRKHYNKIKNK